MKESNQKSKQKNVKPLKSKYENVIFFCFKAKTRFANYESWKQWQDLYETVNK